MAVAVSLTQAIYNPSDDQHELMVEGTLTLSANYGGASSHGDTIDFSTFDQIKSNQPPNRVEIYEEPVAGNAPVGYVFIFGKGTTLANGVLIVMQCGGAAAPFAELTQAAAYPAALTNTDTPPNIKFRARFSIFI